MTDWLTCSGNPKCGCGMRWCCSLDSPCSILTPLPRACCLLFCSSPSLLVPLPCLSSAVEFFISLRVPPCVRSALLSFLSCSVLVPVPRLGNAVRLPRGYPLPSRFPFSDRLLPLRLSSRRKGRTQKAKSKPRPKGRSRQMDGIRGD